MLGNYFLAGGVILTTIGSTVDEIKENIYLRQ